MNKTLTVTHKYDDIIQHPHPRSDTHPPMSLHDRAAQFSPFAALTGYEAAVSETARLTEEKAELDESRKAVLNDQLLQIRSHLPEPVDLTITCFRPDKRKAGGAYQTLSGTVKKLDLTKKQLILTDHTEIPFEQIMELDSPLFADRELL